MAGRDNSDRLFRPSLLGLPSFPPSSLGSTPFADEINSLFLLLSVSRRRKMHMLFQVECNFGHLLGWCSEISS